MSIHSKLFSANKEFFYGTRNSYFLFFRRGAFDPPYDDPQAKRTNPEIITAVRICKVLAKVWEKKN